MTRSTRTFGDAEVAVLQGDITGLEVGAVVNAANDRLRHGGGVAAAIARAGGPVIQAQSDDWVRRHGPLQDGVAAVTDAGDLPAEIVVHVAGPVYDREADDNERRLRSAVAAALDAAEDAGVDSVAFPAISAGIYGYPPDEATAAIADEVAVWLQAEVRTVRRVLLVGFDEATADRFAAGLDAAG